jgi:hypothetical protein
LEEVDDATEIFYKPVSSQTWILKKNIIKYICKIKKK